MERTGMDPPQDDVVGSVWRLWRYPVKSMLGEEVESAEVVWSGLYGNRSYALVDVESSKLVTAKNPAKWARVFECSSRLLDGGGDAAGAPWVEVTLPGGKRFRIADGDCGRAEEALSELFGRQVRFTAARPEPEVATMEEYYAEIEGEPRAGRTIDYVRPMDAQAGTFTDYAAVHLVTSSTLEALSGLHPGEFDPLRFRPDFLVDTGGADGFVESAWVGRTIAVGDEVRLRVFKECGRCVMTTLAQGMLASDTSILSTAMRHNRGKVGVYASVLKAGRVTVRDRVALV